MGLCFQGPRSMMIASQLVLSSKIGLVRNDQKTADFIAIPIFCDILTKFLERLDLFLTH